MDFFNGGKIVVQQDEIIKEGWISKQSRIRKVWREYKSIKISRWCVLTSKHLFSFKNEKIYKRPTEEIQINNLKTVKTEESQTNTFVYFLWFKKIVQGSKIFLFRSPNFEEKEAWIGAVGNFLIYLGKMIIKKSNSNIFISEQEKASSQ